MDAAVRGKLEMLDWDDDLEEWERISGALTLVAPNEPMADDLLLMEDGKAWFRWTND